MWAGIASHGAHHLSARDDPTVALEQQTRGSSSNDRALTAFECSLIDATAHAVRKVEALLPGLEPSIHDGGEVEFFEQADARQGADELVLLLIYLVVQRDG